MVLSSAAALDVGISRESTTSFRRSGHCRSRNSSRISKTLRADFVSSFDMYSKAAAMQCDLEVRAFSSEGETGSRQENASDEESRARFDSIETEKALACHSRKAHHAASKNPPT